MLTLPDDYAAVREMLKDQPGWIKRADLLHKLHGAGCKIDDRELRRIVSDSPVITGQNGYIWHEKATTAEKERCAAGFRSRAYELLSRSRRIDATVCTPGLFD